MVLRAAFLRLSEEPLLAAKFRMAKKVVAGVNGGDRQPLRMAKEVVRSVSACHTRDSFWMPEGEIGRVSGQGHEAEFRMALGIIRADVVPGQFGAGSGYARKSPVEASRMLNPKRSSPKAMAIKKLLALGWRRSSSRTIPGVMIRMTSRRTSPLAWEASSICSQMATLNPRSTNFWIYPETAW